MLAAYRKMLWSAWVSLPEPSMEVIPTNKAELMVRIAPTSDPFDGGRTAAWLEGLREPTWLAVRDTRTGHTIHCVSDRMGTVLDNDLRLGLRLLAWMSAIPERPIVWYWWDQPWPRSLPAETDPGRDHVNGGWAVPGVREVHVYRREEAHKVMLHECVHALALDVPHTAVEPVRKRFEASFGGRRLWPHFGEAYTELFAEWLWSIAGARSLVGAERRWKSQVACATRQAAAVWVRIHDSHIDEDTNIFAYYVMKWVLLRDPEHLAVTLLSPTHAVGFWWSWWLEAQSDLIDLASNAADSENHSLPMGMTCNSHT